jgi:hypothetical protein
MSMTQMMTVRQWTQLLGLGLALAVVIVAIVAVVLPATALALALALAATGVALATRQMQAMARSAQAAVMGAPPAEAATPPVLLLELADGAVLSARPVPLPGQGEHTLVLTREGYLLLGAAGNVVHKL